MWKLSDRIKLVTSQLAVRSCDCVLVTHTVPQRLISRWSDLSLSSWLQHIANQQRQTQQTRDRGVGVILPVINFTLLDSNRQQKLEFQREWWVNATNPMGTVHGVFVPCSGWWHSYRSFSLCWWFHLLKPIAMTPSRLRSIPQWDQKQIQRVKLVQQEVRHAKWRYNEKLHLHFSENDSLTLILGPHSMNTCPWPKNWTKSAIPLKIMGKTCLSPWYLSTAFNISLETYYMLPCFMAGIRSATICHSSKICLSLGPWGVQVRLWLTPPTLDTNSLKLFVSSCLQSTSL